MKWMQTYTGKKVDLLNTDPDTICLEDIAHHLSLQNRFNGATMFPYSVAEHSIRCSYTLAEDPKLSAAALLHDAAEAYWGDIIKPVKYCIPEIEELENKTLEVIFQKFNIPWPLHERVKKVDLRMLMSEKKYIMNDSDIDWGIDAEPYLMSFIPRNPTSVEQDFLWRCTELAIVG